MLTAARLRELLTYDQDTGIFVWCVVTSNRVQVGAIAGTSVRHGHIRIRLDGNLYLAHRLAWLYSYGVWPASKELDHIDGDGSNNRLSNLREATHAQNLQNLHRARSDSRCGLRGINWDARLKKWRARISVHGREVHLGMFLTEELAKDFRDLAAAMLRPFSPEARA